MKKCPQCNTVFGDETVYCQNDGTPLVEETFSLPSTDDFEAETVIRREPIVIDLAADGKFPRQNITYEVPQTSGNVVIVPAKTANSRNYALFLVVGLLLGGGLVLATLLLSKTFSKNENGDSTKANQTEKSVQTIPATENKSSNTLKENKNADAASRTASGIHDEEASASDENFNGRVIATNARVRVSPSADASIADTLPMNDRLNIVERENPNSPWYKIECEHGTTGWMHGNTIEFTR